MRERLSKSLIINPVFENDTVRRSQQGWPWKKRTNKVSNPEVKAKM